MEKQLDTMADRLEESLATHRVVSREEWTRARKELLKKEKELTRLNDELSRQRRELPWVKVDKAYIFEGTEGKLWFSDLFMAKVSSSSTISCLTRNGKKVARAARSWPTTSMAPISICNITTFRW
jgi:hypothetical protein